MLALAVAWAGCSSSGGPGEFPRPGQGLFVTNSNDAFPFTVTEFQGPVKSGPAPSFRDLASADLSEPAGITFDKKGNLWIANRTGHPDGDSGGIDEFTKAQVTALKTNSAPIPVVIISDAENGNDNLDDAEGLAFDSSGNLWVAAFNGNEGDGQLDEFTPAQQVTGSPTPNIILEPNVEGGFFGDVIFDKAGNLWFIDEDNDLVEEYTKAQLAALTPGENEVTPNLIIASEELEFEPEGETFDSKGNLWVTVCDPESGPGVDFGNVLEFTAGQLTGAGTITPAPAVILSPAAVASPPATKMATKSLDCPYGIAFSRNGDLFISNFDSDTFGSLARFKKSTIGTSGAPTPTTFVDADGAGDNLNFPRLIAFGSPLP